MIPLPVELCQQGIFAAETLPLKTSSFPKGSDFSLWGNRGNPELSHFFSI